MSTAAEAMSNGFRHQQAGQLAEAERAYRRALELDPDNAQALHLLGTVALQGGQLQQAIALIGDAIRRDRSQAAFHANLAEAYRRAGDFARAVACNQTALRLDPKLPQIRLKLAILYSQQGNLADAETCFRQVVQASPDDVQTRVLLGQNLYSQGKHADAEASFRRAVRAAGDHVLAHAGLGLALQAQGKSAEARTALEAAAALDPADAKVHNNLACVLKEMHLWTEAEAHFREAIRLEPALTDAYGNLGGLLASLGRYGEAVDFLTVAAERAQGFSPALRNLVVALRELNRLDDVVAVSRRAIELAPDNADLYANLGVCFDALGRLDEAIECHRAASRLDPHNAHLGSNLVYALNYHPAYDPATIFAEHREWGRAHADALTAASRPHANDCTPGRRLRIGYVSGHFWAHAVSFFSEPMLAAHDHAQFEVFCYSSGAKADATTERFKSCADHWRDIAKQSDQQASDLVRSDQIDILVDLAGHIADNRLLLFARKPAPVQVTYLGYQNTTGMAAMDYRLTDAWADPPGTTDAFYTEKLVRLPRAFFCYRPTPDAPPVGPLPRHANGYITFASINNFAKVTPQVLEAWARILQSVPRSRIIILAHAVPSLIEYVTSTLASHGIGAERVTVVDRRPRGEYLKLIQQADIALDPFPFNGHTTTCDALWQGVPVVTLAGRMYAGRFGSSAHVNLGLENLVARSADEYVEIAAGLAGDAQRLAALRAGLRERMAASPLLDFAGFARNLEAAYRQMWAEWCARGSAARAT